MAHWHHIVPRHAGGTDDPSNLIELSVEAHAEAHKQLWETYGKMEDCLAWKGLTGLISKEEIVRTLQAEICRRNFKGKPHFHGEKIGAVMRGRPFTQKHREALKGKRPHVNQTGGNNNAAKKISTPHGLFESTQDAARYLGKDRGYVRYRLERSNYPDWDYVRNS